MATNSIELPGTFHLDDLQKLSDLVKGHFTPMDLRGMEPPPSQQMALKILLDACHVDPKVHPKGKGKPVHLDLGLRMPAYVVTTMSPKLYDQQILMRLTLHADEVSSTKGALFAIAVFDPNDMFQHEGANRDLIDSMTAQTMNGSLGDDHGFIASAPGTRMIPVLRHLWHNASTLK